MLQWIEPIGANRIISLAGVANTSNVMLYRSSTKGIKKPEAAVAELVFHSSQLMLLHSVRESTPDRTVRATFIVVLSAV